jgi:hypothetical protein
MIANWQGRTLREVVDAMDLLEMALRATYSEAFPRLAGALTEPRLAPRYAWEIQIAAGVNALEKSIAHLKRAVLDADPDTLAPPTGANREPRP